MALQSSGQIKFSEIASEFGYPTGNRLGNYRVSQNIGTLTNLPLDSGIPQSGQIKFSNFHGKKANIIVDCYSSGSSNYNQDASVRFKNGDFTVVGGFRTNVPKSAWQGGKRVIININKTFSSSGASSRNHFALQVGAYNNNNNSAGWPNPGTDLSVVFGPNGYVRGKGGNGGQGGWGGDAQRTPGQGAQGTSGLKIHSGMSITGEGVSADSRVIPGGGGGGGGLGGDSTSGGNDEGVPEVRVSGGGGGGGAGTPAGTGGQGFPSILAYQGGFSASPGGSGNASTGGNGGAGGYVIFSMDEDEEVTDFGQGGAGGNGGNVGGANGGQGGGGQGLQSGWSFDQTQVQGQGGQGGFRYITY